LRKERLPSAAQPRPPVAGGRSNRGGVTLLASAAFVAVACGVAWLAGRQWVAVYALGFWHYVLYGLAYRFGTVPLPVFKRDAVLMKSVSLLGLGFVYFSAPLDYASLVAVAAGFCLNALAASALGSDRTYYGYELADLPRLRVTRFPYSFISHPMLVGNMLAYGGLMLNEAFRTQWWPLACAHVALNLGLLAMEHYLTPLRLAATGTAGPARRWSWSGVAGLSTAAAAVAILAAALTGALPALPAAALGVAVAVYAYTLHFAYTAPASSPGDRHPAESERLP
jgi:hypothetical protein